MTRKPRTNRDETEKMLWAAFHKIQQEGRSIGVTEFAEEIGLDRSYFYSFRTLAAAVAEYARKTQPHISHRGPRLHSAQAREREAQETIRREHTQWSREVPVLRESLAQATATIEQQNTLIASLKTEAALLKAAYEYLLLRAFQEGVPLDKLEKFQQEVRERTGLSLAFSQSNP